MNALCFAKYSDEELLPYLEDDAEFEAVANAYDALVADAEFETAANAYDA